MRTTLNEVSFIRVYRELTGANEAQARSAFMFACCREDARDVDADDEAAHQTTSPEWAEVVTHEYASKSRPVPHVHQLPVAGRERFA